MPQKSVLLLIPILISLATQAQTYVFRMELFGDSVGVSVMNKRSSNGIDEYSLDSKIRAKVLWIIRENHTHYESKYKDGKLLSASFAEVNNGKKDKWSYITNNGKEYTVENQHGKKTVAEPPAFSIGALYMDRFNPSRKHFFYEPDGEYIELKNPEKDVIEFKGYDGNKNVFRFKNGEINKVEFHTTIATVYLTRIR